MFMHIIASSIYEFTRSKGSIFCIIVHKNYMSCIFILTCRLVSLFDQVERQQTPSVVCSLSEQELTGCSRQCNTVIQVPSSYTKSMYVLVILKLICTFHLIEIIKCACFNPSNQNMQCYLYWSIILFVFGINICPSS